MYSMNYVIASQKIQVINNVYTYKSNFKTKPPDIMSSYNWNAWQTTQKITKTAVFSCMY